MLKSLRIKASPSNREYKITGLTEKPCKEQTSVCLFHYKSIFLFSTCCGLICFRARKDLISVVLCFSFTLKQKSGNGMAGEEKEVELTVYEYFTYHRHIPLNYSGDFPCINVGKPKHPTFIPLEVLDNLHLICAAFNVCDLTVLLSFLSALPPGVSATLYQGAVQSTKGFPGRKIPTEAPRKNENIE